MTYIAKPKFHHPGLPKNDLGFTHRDYEGKISTLCAGCGHDSITASIIEACYELSIEPHRVAKISGIGCSSKTPDYFLGNSHGFNSVHGRMPSVLTGANLANRDLIYLGVSGDGDSASIGFGQFAHSIRRGVNMTYIVENNGVYGLTKGQFSATADRGSKNKKGVMNTDNAIDLVAIALQLGASFVARSFSGDKTQLVPLIAAAIQHKGAAFIDVISPCVAFNNHAGSTKSFDYVREHNDAVNRLDVITGRDPITVDYAPGTVQMVEQHDGTKLALRKIDADYDPHDRLGGDDVPAEARRQGPDRHRVALRRSGVGRPAQPSQHGGDAAQHAGRASDCVRARLRWTRSTPACAEIRRWRDGPRGQNQQPLFAKADSMISGRVGTASLRSRFGDVRDGASSRRLLPAEAKRILDRLIGRPAAGWPNRNAHRRRPQKPCWVHWQDRIANASRPRLSRLDGGAAMIR